MQRSLLLDLQDASQEAERVLASLEALAAQCLTSAGPSGALQALHDHAKAFRTVFRPSRQTWWRPSRTSGMPSVPRMTTPRLGPRGTTRPTYDARPHPHLPWRPHCP